MTAPPRAPALRRWIDVGGEHPAVQRGLLVPPAYDDSDEGRREHG